MLDFFKTALGLLRSHKIHIRPQDRKIGVKETLIGWSLIAASIVFFKDSTKELPVEVNLGFQFFAATLVLTIASLFKGRSFLKIKEESMTDLSKQNILTIPQRKLFIFIRSVIAILGYMVFRLSVSHTTKVDNSSIHSIDAVIYLLMMWFFLKEKITFLQIVSVAIVTFGVLIVFSSDLSTIGLRDTIITVFEGVLSAIALALIYLMTSIIVQHDPPMRVAFYQCFTGLILSIVFIVGEIIFGHIQFTASFPAILNSSMVGVIYGIALLFFFEAFLYTEPIIIVVLGYSLTPFVFFFQWAVSQETIPLKNFISAFSIALGGGLLIYNGYRNDKKAKWPYYFPIYSMSLSEEMKYLSELFIKGKIEFFYYVSKIHEFNKLLFDFSARIRNTDIEKIEIRKDNVYFFLSPENITMLSDEACRSAPLEILNFGKYEPEESKFVFRMIQDGDVIFDVGAHVGWYSINFSKRFPASIIYSFEPIFNTYGILEKNIEINKSKNILVFNFGLSNKTEILSFHYSKRLSPLASQENLVDYEDDQRIQCDLKKLDEIFFSLKTNKIDFIKIDVEGSELKVIEGSINTLKQFEPIIYIELYNPWCARFGYCADDVLGILKNLGYHCFSVYGDRLQKEENITNKDDKYNYFFLHAKKHEKIIGNFS